MKVKFKTTRTQFELLVKELIPAVKEVESFSMLKSYSYDELLELFVSLTISETLKNDFGKRLFKDWGKTEVSLDAHKALAIQLYLHLVICENPIDVTLIDEILEQIRQQLQTYKLK